MSAARIAAAAVLAAGAYVMWANQDAADQAQQEEGGDWQDAAGNIVGEAAEALAGAVDFATGGFMRIAYMSKAKPQMLNNQNVRAMLAVIRAGEGTADEAGYRRIFGGRLFDSYADHPRVLVSKSGYSSTAAGAYQMLERVWDETRSVMSLPDFSPASQDMAALGRIAARGALDDVLAGRFAVAIGKLGKEWASLPGSPYGQPTMTLNKARAVFIAAGGADAGTVYA